MYIRSSLSRRLRRTALISDYSTLEDLIKEVQGHGMVRVFKKDGELTKDGWTHYERLVSVLYMTCRLTGEGDDTFDRIVGRLEEILLSFSTDRARKKMEERLYG